MSVRRGEPLYAQVAEQLRDDIRAGRIPPGGQLPSERDLTERFDVSAGTVKAALVQLRTEGIIYSRQGRGVFVADQSPLRRLSDDITMGEGFYTMLERVGRQPATITTVTRGPASDDVADALGVPPGSDVVIRDRILRAEGGPPVGLATSYFPVWVVDAAPELADPNVSGLPKWLRQAFGPNYSDDLIGARMPTLDERQRLELAEGVPVITVHGVTRDHQHRPLHFIVKATAAGRMPLVYRFGDVPEDA